MNRLLVRLAASAAMLALLAVATPARAALIAADSFNVPPYAVGALNGQAVGGTGFTGAWTQFLAEDLSILASGKVGRPAPGPGGQAGDFALFAGGGFTVTSGQLYISYDIDNPTATNLSSSRLDLNTSITPLSASLGAFGVQANFNFSTAFGFGSTAVAQTNIASTGAHHLVGVLDFTNGQIAIFVDPTGSSFYNPNGTNNANATAAWTPPVGAYLATSYSLIDNLNDVATFDNVRFSTDGLNAGLGVPEPASLTLAALGVLGAAGYGWRRPRKQPA